MAKKWKLRKLWLMLILRVKNEYGKNEPNFYYETLLNAISRYETGT